MPIKDTELILNADGSVYHLNLKPKHIANTIIFVGDQDRVSLVTKHFDAIEYTIQKREFKTQTGYYKNKRITVLSTGIGSDNIDIVLNELDALVNIDFETRSIKPKLTALNIIRIGTSGALQNNIPLDSFLISTYGLDLNGLLQAYKIKEHANPTFEAQFMKHTQWCASKASPLLIQNSASLQQYFDNTNIYKGITATAGGFYGPQGRMLRLEPKDDALNSKIESFKFEALKITNLEMETSAIYGLSKLLGHNAISLNALIANRKTGKFSNTPDQTIENLISYALTCIIKIP